LRGRRSICCSEAPILAWHDDHGEVRHADRVDVVTGKMRWSPVVARST
jgi:hypothetical protein